MVVINFNISGKETEVVKEHYHFGANDFTRILSLWVPLNQNFCRDRDIILFKIIVLLNINSVALQLYTFNNTNENVIYSLLYSSVTVGPIDQHFLKEHFKTLIVFAYTL